MTHSVRTADASGCAVLSNLVSNIPTSNVCGPNSERLRASLASDGILEFRGSVDL